MFDRSKRDTKDDTFPAIESREPSISPESRTPRGEAAVIGPSIQISGDLSGEEDLVIQGRVQGTIQLKEKSLTVGSRGKVEANVLAHTVIVEGQVKGDLYGSERVSIRKTGEVHGNIVSPKVSLDEGCRFKGSIDMDEEAVSKAFGKPASAKPGLAPTQPKEAQPKAAEPPAPAKTESALAGGAEVKSGSAG